MNNIFIDQSTERKGNIVRDKLSFIDNVPVFSVVELNIMAACTRSCSFCPVSDKDFYKKIDAKGLLKKDFYKKILSDLSAINYKGKILYSGFSEPLLHPKIDELIQLTKEYLPDTQLEMISNGDKLTVAKLKSLFENGLDVLSISMYDGSHQIDYFSNMIHDANVDKEKVILRRRYYENGNYGLTISNRAGLVDSNEYRAEGEEKILELPLKKVCYYPFYMVKIDFNGDMDICSHDWQKKFVVGNVNTSSVWELWTSDRLHKFKERLANSDRKMEPCSTCDVHGDIIGKESFEAWNTK
ncbi:MAG: radical SAM protein [Sulfuricurvum sp. PD_MW2]|jgi:radical SAM protein with 4Fe4S-binding SPASM domain|uniref:radical SAM/SPASM domain-containing protein n=1 Tax=Sulfuricurvum sp. PD_MW2 TaxID=2027917 RepID=UPI000C060B7D|nr:SPASM domain-containing protein [Sulfuricurvum sp. PD_MW2]PHM16461.1 MAG: radical SAM protein [Sulfuricurvum sp. PD_MW2]